MKFIKTSFKPICDLDFRGLVASGILSGIACVLCCTFGLLLPTQSLDAMQAVMPLNIQPIQSDSSLPQETYSTPKYDFAPPSIGSRRPEPAGLETGIGSGLTGVSPRETSGGQIGNFVTPLSGQEESGLQFNVQPENRDSTGDGIGGAKQLSETSGRVEVIRERYPDGKVQIMRQVTQDKDRNYFNHGSWQLFNRRGEVMGQGEYYLGRMEGQWKRWHPSNGAGLFSTAPFNQFSGPYLSVAEFSGGELSGVWTIADRGKNPIFEASYQEGVRHGTATWYHTTGSKLRECTFREGVLDGPLFEWDKDGKTTVQEEYIKGRKVISDVQYANRRQKLSESFYLAPVLELDGEDSWWEAKPANFVSSGQRVQHGPTGTWHANGQPKMQGQFDNGKRVGTFVGWHANGQKEVIGQFEAGKKVGGWTWWHPNGFKRIEGRYADDAPVGDWTWWNEDGSVRNKQDMTAASILEKDPESGQEQTDPKTGSESDDPNDEGIQSEGMEEIEGEEIPAQELPPKSTNNEIDQPPATIDIPDDVIPYESRRPVIESDLESKEPISNEDPFEEFQKFEELDDRFMDDSGIGIESEPEQGDMIEGTLRRNRDAEEIKAIPEPDDEILQPNPFGPAEPIEDPFGDNAQQS